ncbi:hypothetical protein [Brucella sp. NBRC 12950]|uniref:hypothetical protein n=1 Tax=Brucella sp. NBRC 12950 TaxID=2994518 RepID=UPI0024A37FDA|nr:hypothetical protein [Brucella sp. NBRC 12950]GLU29099.1 hypothetical protein Brsp01_43320 [Brucella sp. NBRC 12950]
MLPTIHHDNADETARSLTRSQQNALRAIAFFRHQKKIGTGWLVGDQRLSNRVINRLEQLDLVEENVLRGAPILQLTIVGEAMKAKLLQ